MSFKKHLALFLREHSPEAHRRVLLKKKIFTEAVENNKAFMFKVPQDDPFMINAMCKEIQGLEEEELRKIDEVNAKASASMDIALSLLEAKSTDVEKAVCEGKALFPDNFYVIQNVCPHVAPTPRHLIEDVSPTILLSAVIPKPKYGQMVSIFDYESECYGEPEPDLVFLWEVPTKGVCDDLLSGRRVGNWEKDLHKSVLEFVNGEVMKLYEEYCR